MVSIKKKKESIVYEVFIKALDEVSENEGLFLEFKGDHCDLVLHRYTELMKIARHIDEQI